MKGACSVADQQTVQRWMITVGGVEQARVGAGQTVEIGRKPIRPLRDDGFVRIDIVDNKRSMSKRHALLIVNKRGVATIRDLHSTNGTYLVGDNGNLLRLDPDVDFQLPDTIMRMQFGDVPVDFVHVEESEDSDNDPVRDLFSYATDSAPKEPDASDLSVDQILDLRAGEPTGIFHAQSVSVPELKWNNDSVSLNPEKNSVIDDISSAGVDLPVVREEEKAEPRNLFDDAQADGNKDSNKDNQEQNPEDSSNLNSAQTDDNPNEHENDVEQLLNQSMEQSMEQSVKRDDEQHDIREQDIFESVENEFAEAKSVENNPAETNPDESNPVENRNSSVENNSAEVGNAEANNAEANNAEVNNAENIASSMLASSTFSEEYTPAFEPGSVFEKVSQGEFDSHHEVIEAGGYTSDEAKQTADFSEQFEMAKYPELLPYLAMNTGLYDDLYAWLAAQSNSDVDEALARNSGYDAYRKTMGK